MPKESGRSFSTSTAVHPAEERSPHAGTAATSTRERYHGRSVAFGGGKAAVKPRESPTTSTEIGPLGPAAVVVGVGAVAAAGRTIGGGADVVGSGGGTVVVAGAAVVLVGGGDVVGRSGDVFDTLRASIIVLSGVDER